MVEYLIDTNVLIAVLKGNARLKSFVEKLNCALDTVAYVELIQGAKNKSEVQKIEKYLTRFELIHFEKMVAQKSIELVRMYSKSHGLMLGDAVIAATCLENDLTLITYNTRDFQFIDNLKILHPPV